MQADKLTLIQYEQFKSVLDEKNLCTAHKNKIHQLVNALYKFGRKYYGIKNNVVEISGRFIKKENEVKKTNFYTYDEYMFLNQI